MRIAALAFACLVIAACKQDRTADAPARPGERGWTSSTGEVSLTDGETLSFTITSERYKAWDAAKEGLDSRIVSRYGAILQPGSPSRRNIEKAVRYLESEPAAKAAIERAGMSVRDFVVTTVALEQEMKLASARGEIPPDTLPTPIHQAYPMDTSSFGASTYTPIPLPEPVPVVRQYIDTVAPRDTTPPGSFVITRTDTTTRRFPIADSIARAAAVRDSLARRRQSRDSNVVRRDSVVKRDTAPAARRDSVRPAPVDTSRDTIPAVRRRA